MCGCPATHLTLLQRNPDIYCFYDHGINIYMIDHCLSVFPVSISESVYSFYYQV